MLNVLGPDYKNFIIDSLMKLNTMIKPSIPQTPELTFCENHANSLPISAPVNALNVNTDLPRVICASSQPLTINMDSSPDSVAASAISTPPSTSTARLLPSNQVEDGSINTSVSAHYPPPKSIESTFAQVLKTWHDYDLENVINVTDIKHKRIKLQ